MAPPNFKNFMWSGCICCYNSCEMDDMLIGCAGEGDELCIYSKVCLGVPNESNPVMPVGMVQEEGYICKISAPCCQYGCKKPTVCVSSKGQCLCMKGAASFPFNEAVPGPVCGFCGIKILPGPVGFLQPYDAGGAPSAKVVAR